MTNRILIVDDIDLNRDILKEILQESYEILEAENGFEALDIILTHNEKVDLVLLDINMPEMDGFEVLDILNKNDLLSELPVIMITTEGDYEVEIKCLNLGAADFLNKPFYSEIVLSRIKTHIELKRNKDKLNQLKLENFDNVIKVRDKMISFLSNLIEHKSYDEVKNSNNVISMSHKLLKLIEKSGQMEDEISNVDIMLIAKAAPLHDIGQINIPDKIMLKSGKLDMNEFDLIKKHPQNGANIFDGLKTLEAFEEDNYIGYCREICLYHHERFDGTGYPYRLKGKEIPFSARVLSIIDVYIALTCEKPYKLEYSHEKAIEIIKEETGTHFDPDIARIFIDNNELFKRI